jgi:hypothetical protein
MSAKVPCAGGLGEGGLGLELGGHAAEAVEAVEGDVRDVAHVGRPPDLHPRLLLLAAAGDLILLLAAAARVHPDQSDPMPAVLRAGRTRTARGLDVAAKTTRYSRT